MRTLVYYHEYLNELVLIDDGDERQWITVEEMRMDMYAKYSVSVGVTHYRLTRKECTFIGYY